MTTAVVFGYGDVGIRCTATLLARGLDVTLVASHADDPGEAQWYGSLARFAAEHDLSVHLSADASDPSLLARIRDIRPDFIFSFYYRRMLKPALLACARRGAFNMHGSLLPKYRGAAPVACAILGGETQTGVTIIKVTPGLDSGRQQGEAAQAELARIRAENSRLAESAQTLAKDKTTLEQRLAAAAQTKAPPAPPSPAAARAVSMRRMRPCAIGLRSVQPTSSPGKRISPAYFAAPVTFSAPSTRQMFFAIV